MPTNNPLYEHGIEFIKDLHRLVEEAGNYESLPEETRKHFAKISHFTELMHGSLYKDNGPGSCAFCLLTNITDDSGKFDPAGIEAMAKLLAQTHREKVALQAKLEHLRWLFGHVQEAMK